MLSSFGSHRNILPFGEAVEILISLGDFPSHLTTETGTTYIDVHMAAWMISFSVQLSAAS